MKVSRFSIISVLVSGLAVAAVLFSPRASFAQETGAATAAGDGIVVQGTGEVKVTPDIARMTLGVVTQDKDATKAAQANADKTDAIIKAIRGAGIAEKDIQTSGYSLSPQYNGGLGGGGNQRLPPTYEARNSVIVTVRKISDTGKTIDAAIKAEANLAGVITFSMNDEAARKARDEALSRAVVDAKRKAAVIAKAAATGAIFLVAISENGVTFPRLFGEYAMVAGRQVPGTVTPVTPVTPGEQSVTATVTIRYSINNGLQPNY